MDIQKWLRDTADARQLSPADRRDPMPIVAPTTNAVEHQKKETRKRKKAIDSSLIEPQQAHQHNTHDRRRPATTDHQRTNSGSSSSRSDRPSDDAESHQSEDNPYRRRKRRKTHPDRYDEKPAKAAKRDRSKRKADNKTKDEKRSKRKRKDTSEAALVRDYKAKNVSATRLTLPSMSNIGLFKKGRASSPFRARGVPDLAFSEMKFLQKRRESTEDEPPKRSDRARRKRDRTRAAEEEMSAYFAPNKPVLTERDPNIVSKAPKHTKSAKERHGDRADKIRPISEVPIEPTIELPERPFLGFGSSGPRLQPRPRSRSATYYTWSESAQHPSTLPCAHPHSNIIGVGALNISPIQPNATARSPSKPTGAAFVSQISPDTGRQLPNNQANATRYTKQDRRGQTEHQDSLRQRPNRPDVLSVRRDRSVTRSKDCSSHGIATQRHRPTRDADIESNLETGGRETEDRASRGAETLKQTERRPSRWSPQEVVQETTAQRVSSPLAELLQKCEQSATTVQQPTLVNVPGLETANLQYEEVEPFQYHGGYAEEYVDRGSSQSVRHSSRGPLPNLYPELRGFDQGMAIEDDPDCYEETLIGANADLWQEEGGLGTELDGTGGLSYSYEDDIVLDAANNLGSPVEDEAAAQEASDLLLSAHSAQGQHVSGDWYEDVQGEEQVPAGFWRPNRLY